MPGLNDRLEEYNLAILYTSYAVILIYIIWYRYCLDLGILLGIFIWYSYGCNLRVIIFFSKTNKFKMGKSVRSKQQRINRSNRRNLIHKPVEDKRLERILEKGLADKLVSLPVEQGEQDVLMDPVLESQDRVLTQKEKRDLILNRNQKKRKMQKVRKVKISKNLKKFE